MSLCTPNKPILWNHVYQLVNKLDQAGQALVNDYEPLTNTIKTFNLENYRQTTITYQWTYSDPNPIYCSPDAHGIVFANGSKSGWFNTEELYCYDQQRDLYFIGAAPGSGISLNTPCLCCLKGYVVPGGGSFSYGLTPYENPPPDPSCANGEGTAECEWRPNMDTPCGDNTCHLSLPKMAEFLNIEYAGNPYVVTFPICPNGGQFFASYNWDNDRMLYVLKRVDLPLSGYFGWPIRKSQFNTIVSRIEYIIANACPKFETILEAGKDSPNWIEKTGNCPWLGDVVWTKINKNNLGGDPGCFEYNTGEENVLYPWESETCGGQTCESSNGNYLVYCKTINNLESVIDSLQTYFKEKSTEAAPPDCCNQGSPSCRIIANSKCGSGFIDTRCAFEEFTAPAQGTEGEEGYVPAVEASCPPKYYRTRTTIYYNHWNFNGASPKFHSNFLTEYKFDSTETETWETNEETGQCEKKSIFGGTSSYMAFSVFDDCLIYDDTCGATQAEDGTWSFSSRHVGHCDDPTPPETSNGNGFCVLYDDNIPYYDPVVTTSRTEQVSERTVVPYDPSNLDPGDTASRSGSEKTTVTLSDEITLDDVLSERVCNQVRCTSIDAPDPNVGHCYYCCTNRGGIQEGLAYVYPPSPEGCVYTGESMSAWGGSLCNGSAARGGQTSALTLVLKNLTPGSWYTVTVTYLSQEIEEFDESNICSFVLNENSTPTESTDTVGPFQANNWAEIMGNCNECNVMYTRCQLEDEANDWNQQNPDGPARSVGCTGSSAILNVQNSHYVLTYVTKCEIEEVSAPEQT